MIRITFTAFAVPLVVEGPSWHTCREYARVVLGSSELDEEPAVRCPRDMRLRWVGNDASVSGTRHLQVSRRVDGAWTPWARDVLVSEGKGSKARRRAMEVEHGEDVE